MKARLFVPAHAEPCEKIAELAQYNIDKVWEIARRILDICREACSFEGILQKLFSDYGLQMNFEQYVLVGSTVRSYLSWLKDTGYLDSIFDDNRLLWKRVEGRENHGN